MTRGVWIGIAALVAGCATAPPVAPPSLDVATPESWTARTDTGDAPDFGWWRDFGDAALDDVVLAALEENYDLQAAAARLEQAAADSRIAAADLQPTVQAGLNGSRRKQNFIGFPIPGSENQVLSTVFTNYGVSVDTTWEADLWGRLRSGARAALADLQSRAADLRGAQLSITGQTVKTWFAIAEAEQQLRLAEASVASFSTSSDQVRGRFEQGLRPALDVRLSLSNLANAEALRAQRRQQLDATTRQLDVLLGRYASGARSTPSTLPDTPPAIPGGLPADLVSRRPDLVAAERRIAAASQRLHVARTELYPRLSLTGNTGTATSALADLVDGDFGVWSLLGNLLQPVFQGGRLRAGVDRAEARAAEELATYANTALNAYAEVETALAAEEFLADRERHLETSVEQSRAAEDLAEDRYRTGLDDYITVLESQRLALQAEGDLIAARRQRLENRVDLYLALGGGFDELAAPVTVSQP
ncbi:MAG: transporter [Acidobacteria bacterium]|jgi:NodT family efflux transporter outer membrane factor (OMF) lipoprotein|nr:transporter [Acidobacteriota bacterium]MDP7338036.1 efflux transporter outer membrane subunit [Vicinamibacterales bacterium]MDP7481026.1 efflux transporter outer membrane subunit [Vicinamibacterales bacterium]MDP7690475.1 efflux transporter outer membrane subunit [Vicinamibacterales bacterium]HJN43324.1 efflux transporter outer membrane subunit [Vicinamibacterales bacterium]